MKSRLLLFGLVTALLASSNQTAPAQTSSVSALQISSVFDEWCKDWKAGDVEALGELYAQDATLFPTIGRSVEGRAAIGDYFKQHFEQFPDPNSPDGQRLRLSKGEMVFQASPEYSGDLAYVNGIMVYFTKGKCKPADVGDGPCVIKGYHLTILKQSPDGKWLIAIQSLTQIGLGSTIYTPH